MVFSSITFLFVFLPAFLAVYFVLKDRLKNAFLLLASLIFYYWGEPGFAIIMVVSIIWNYLCGLVCCFLGKKGLLFRRLALSMAISINLGLLFYFKYFDFAIKTVNRIFALELPLKDIALPIGISFFTFQGMSYVFDVYQQKVEPQKNLLKLGVYISMFPQLIAGPIVRYTDIERELTKRTVTPSDFCVGISRFVVGLAKKVIISNTLAYPVDQIFSLPPTVISRGTAWLGAVFYMFQIYFDFSGYSDMAIGLGKMLGFNFMENFNLPYISKSVTEFWRRWHISLSAWFRDYVYIPLGGNRTGNVYLHLLTVFILTGLWHGASWNFVIWGLWHGMFLIIEKIFMRRGTPWGGVGAWIYTMLVVLIGWVLFRADTLFYALQYLKTMFFGNPSAALYYETAYFWDYFTLFVLAIALIGSSGIWKKVWNPMKMRGGTASFAVERIILIGLFAVCAVMVLASTYNPFIYFRF